MRRSAHSSLLSLIALTLVASCGEPPSEPARQPAQPELELGDWRAVLTSPGGQLPFGLSIHQGPEGLEATASNGPEEVPFSGVTAEGSSVVLEFSWYDSRIKAELEPAGRSLTGEWTRTNHGGAVTRMPFSATFGGGPRFEPLPPEDGADSPESVAGIWAANFVDGDGTEAARAEFQQEGDEVLGTFLTPTGDYRFLAGSFENATLRLSTFDGAHAFLFSATLAEDGTLSGDFHSRDSYHATWTAERADESAELLPDAWSEVGLTNTEGTFSFSFPDLDGNTVSLADDRFADKVVVVNIFGSWCPNCNDEAPLLAEWDRRWGDDGLELVGLAYEFTGDPTRDREFVARYAQRHGIEYPLLLAGTSDKAQASETLPDLTAVLAYPTTIFIGRDGKVAKIHSGFTGPGTGEHYTELVAELEAVIEDLLAADAPRTLQP